MTRSKNFIREDVLEKVVPLFWRKGYASTSMRDIELETGVNKSGLYSEFKDKEDIYLASLSYYTLTQGGKQILEASPAGWNNIEKFMRHLLTDQGEFEGCFVMFSLRDIGLFSTGGKKNIFHHLEKLRSLILKNIESEKSTVDAEQLTDMIGMFFGGLALMENSEASVNSDESIKIFMNAIRKL